VLLEPDAIPEGVRRELRYTARAGLLPELSRQTYDAFYKAVREVVLNSLDAGATRVTLDFTSVERDREISVSDDGCGMTLSEVEGSFLSLGGSRKFGEASKFGRIGIGSLALLHYGDSASIETKVSGEAVVTQVSLQHPWALDRQQRSQRLDEVSAGSATQVPYVGDVSDHFTIVRLYDISEVVLREVGDISSFYALVDRLRVVLPLTMPETRLTQSLQEHAAEAWQVISEHAADFAGHVHIRSAWGDIDALDRRLYGDRPDEAWDGQPRVLLRDVPVPHTGRTLTLAGYLLSQSHALPVWSGLTARVQNVAVEERTFFDVESDPGFRKYLTGEVFLLGELDRARLINIDRTTFNRESPDYRAVQRVLADEIVRFKADRIQGPRRAKVGARRRVDSIRAMLIAAERACHAVNAWCEERGISRIPSSGVRLPKDVQRVSVPVACAQAACNVRVSTAVGPKDFLVELDESGESPIVQLGAWFAEPVVELAGRQYQLVLIRAPSLPPVVLRDRPRELMLNLDHPAFRDTEEGVQFALMLEVGYVVCPETRAIDLYDSVLEISSYL